MTDLVWDFEVDGGNFELAGSASQTTKSRLKQLINLLCQLKTIRE